MTTLAPTEYKSQADLARIYRRTLNELPVPAGPWAKTYAERNTKYNRQLAASVVFAIFTTIAVRCKSIYFQSWDGFTKTMSSELNEKHHYTQFVITLKMRLKNQPLYYRLHYFRKGPDRLHYQAAPYEMQHV